MIWIERIYHFKDVYGIHLNSLDVYLFKILLLQISYILPFESWVEAPQSLHGFQNMTIPSVLSVSGFWSMTVLITDSI